MIVSSEGSFFLDGRRPLPLDEAVARREELLRAGRRLVFTNGCFDLLHVGHLFLLEKTALLADQLWVAINSDSSVQALKGSSRPLQGERERAYALLCLEFVDAVIVFHSERVVREIQLLKPDAYAKGGDYSLDTLDAAERIALEAAGTEIHFIPFLEGYGTTDLIQRINSVPNT